MARKIQGACDGAELNLYRAGSTTKQVHFRYRGRAWEAVDASVPASEWTPDRRAIEHSVQPSLNAYAADLQQACDQTADPILEDLAIAAALCMRAYASVGDTYTSVSSGRKLSR